MPAQLREADDLEALPWAIAEFPNYRHLIPRFRYLSASCRRVAILGDNTARLRAALGTGRDAMAADHRAGVGVGLTPRRGGVAARQGEWHCRDKATLRQPHRSRESPPATLGRVTSTDS
jgi:hypothetical protein